MNGDDEYDDLSALAHQQELDWQELLSLDHAYAEWLDLLNRQRKDHESTDDTSKRL